MTTKDVEVGEVQAEADGVPVAYKETGDADPRRAAPAGSAEAGAAYLRIDGLHKHFTRPGGKAASVLDDVSLSLGEGELVSLLGPSGCGKTTTLRCVAGLERPDRGSIWVRGDPVVDAATGRFVPPEHRRIGMAFQSYALWPHMRIVDNVAYPLRMAGVGRTDRRRRAGEVLARVGLDRKLDRYPRELSGGEQQRVALARAIVANPDVLLLDEPLSNLDAQLRQQTLVWLVGLLRELRITTIYVTHDQSEALAISDQIVVMRSGSVLQRGTPSEIYERPATSFVAGFVGAANLLAGRVVGTGAGGWRVAPAAGGREYVGRPPAGASQLTIGDEVGLVVRPEVIRTAAVADGIDAVVELRVYAGSGWQYSMRVGDDVIRVTTGPETVLDIGSRVCLTFGGPDLPLVLDMEQPRNSDEVPTP